MQEALTAIALAALERLPDVAPSIAILTLYYIVVGCGIGGPAVQNISRTGMIPTHWHRAGAWGRSPVVLRYRIEHRQRETRYSDSRSSFPDLKIGIIGGW